MKKVNRSISICLIISMMLAIFVACTPSKEDVIGTYVGIYEYNGDNYTVEIVLSEDGKYTKSKAKNNGIPFTEKGEFEIDGKKVLLYKFNDKGTKDTYTEYIYKKNTLKNNKHKFVKQ